MTSIDSNHGFVITAFWETKPGEEDSVAGLLRQFLPEARKEQGVKEFQIHQSVTKPQEFFFYEVFAAADRAFQEIHPRRGNSEACQA